MTNHPNRKIIAIGYRFRAAGQFWTVEARQRGRQGEARTMYIVRPDGGLPEARTREWVLAQPGVPA